ncbi:MAG: hypothetical protein KJ749_10840 [Planctomycetes bacterium]|nr:hypothetical protein [Planctomycetota bacterium]
MKTWQLAVVVLIVILTFALLNWCRDGDTWHIVQSLPLLGGYQPGIYDVAGLIMLLMVINGIRKIRRKDDE